MDKDQVTLLRQTVEAAGAHWVGVQHAATDDEFDLVLFNSPQTHTTLALPANEFFTIQAVKDKLAASNLNFGGNE